MRIVFMGTPDFAVPSLKSLIDNGYNVVGVVTQPDKPKGRKQVLTKPPIKIVAEEHGIDVFQPRKIKEESAVDHILNEWNPDLIVSAAYGQIIPDKLLFTPKYKAINVHASLLPKFRGAAPIHQSIIQGEKETGVTIMYMVKALDAGDMLGKVTVSIHSNDTVATLHDRLSIEGAKLLIETIRKIENGTIDPIKQDDEAATYAPTLKRQDELINWSKPNTDVYNQIRGLNPWPVAFTYFRQEVFKIWWAEIVELDHKEAPGTIIKADKEKLIVATGEGAISLKEIQPSGKKKMEIISYLQGANISVGEKMGEVDENNQ